MWSLSSSKSQTSLPRDPAPSKWAYRWERLWLRPGFRRSLRLGVPAALLIGATAWFFEDAERRDGLVEIVANLKNEIQTRPEFMVKLMAIDGGSARLAADIRDVMPMDLPVSSFDLDLDAMRDQVESLDAVKQADLRILAGGVLQIDIVERVPMMIWRGPDGLELLDKDGHKVGPIASRQLRKDLPLIAGEGADVVVPEALDLLTVAGPITQQIIGLVRMSELRWDIVLDGGQRIMLPEKGAISALDRVIALHEAQDLLSRDLARIDMRNGQRPILRLAAGALQEMHDIRQIEIKRAEQQ